MRPFAIRLTRLVIPVYAAALAVWLLLGLVPTFLVAIPAVRNGLAQAASGSGWVAGEAAMVVRAQSAEMTVPAADAVLQYVFSMVNFALGLLLYRRRPTELVPVLLAFALLGTAATFNEPSHQVFHIIGSPWPVALAHFTFHVASGVAYLWAVVLFPDGTLPRRIAIAPAARRLAVVAVTAAAVVVCWTSSFLSHPQFFVVFFGIAIAAAGAACAVLRFTDPRTPPRERSIARLLFGALLPALAVSVCWVGAVLVEGGQGRAAAAAGQAADAFQSWFPLVFAIVPVVLCAGVARYRLWEIDRLVGRVLVYGLLVGAVTIAWVAVLVAGGAVIGGSWWWTMALVAAVATAVEPLRVRVTRWANRVVYGQDLAPAEAVSALIDGLEQLSPAGGLDQVVRVAVQATRCRSSALWLLEGDRLLPLAAEPADAPTDPGPEVSGMSVEPERLGQLLGGYCRPIRQEGRLLGILQARTDPGVSLSRSDRALLSELADHAALLLTNSLLTVRLAQDVRELTDRVRELRTARRLVVTTGDGERRRLERDLHDGAQQAVVAALIGLKMMAATAERAARTGDRAALITALDTAQTWLLELCTGGRPAILSERGLAGALRAAAALLPADHGDDGVRITVSQAPARPADVDQQGWEAIETAVYFSCLEGLQNALKHAAAHRVTITLSVEEAEYAFQVRDDGTGFTSAADPDGGLAALTGRLAVLGGGLTVTSAPAAGTQLTGRIPLPERSATLPVDTAGRAS